MIFSGARSKPGRALRLALLVLHVSVVGLAPAADAGLLEHSQPSHSQQTPGDDTHSDHDSSTCQFCQLIAVSGTVPGAPLGHFETPQLVHVSVPPFEHRSYSSGCHFTTHSRAPPQA